MHTLSSSALFDELIQLHCDQPGAQRDVLFWPCITTGLCVTDVSVFQPFTCTLLSMTTANSQYSGKVSWSLVQVIMITRTLLSMTTANSQYSGEVSWSLVQVIMITRTLLSMTTANSQYSGEVSWSLVQVIMITCTLLSMTTANSQYSGEGQLVSCPGHHDYLHSAINDHS